MQNKINSRLTTLAIIILAVVGFSCGDDDNDNGVNSDNNPPTISAISAQPDTFVSYSVTTVTVVAEDVDGDVLTYAWTSSESWLTPLPSLVSTVEYTNCCAVTEIQTAWAIATVSDGNGGQAVDSIQLWVTP